MAIPFTPPSFRTTSFNCPHCNAFSRQVWKEASYYEGGYNSLDDLDLCFCTHCGKYSIWLNGIMINPEDSVVDPVNQDLSSDIQADYNEAASIMQRSPRGAAALLRLVVQKVCIQLGKDGKDLNQDIGQLVKEGLPVKVQLALDTVRVIGNEAIHPGQMDLKDDQATAVHLFKLVNFIAEKMITEPKTVDELFGKVPEGKKQQISQRDSG